MLGVLRVDLLSDQIGKGANNGGQFERGQLVQAILTKGGLHLPKVLVVTPSWAPW